LSVEIIIIITVVVVVVVVAAAAAAATAEDPYDFGAVDEVIMFVNEG
jgi:uncharacterized protein YpmB